MSDKGGVITKSVFHLAAVVFASLWALPTLAQLPVRHVLPVALAKQMADVATQTCAEMGFSVSVHVVNAAGDTLVAYRGETSGVHTFTNSFRKAYSAMTFRRPSATFGERWEDGDVGAQLQLMLPDMAGQQGGIPIRVGEEVIGGIGASGAGMGADSRCVQAGLDAISENLR